MGSKVAAPSTASILLLLMVAVFATLSTTHAQLSTSFYKSSCPNAVNVITSAVNTAFNKRAASAAGVLRIHFHDCFVRGCDASVLIDSPSEKDARPNLSLQGFEVIDAAKTAIEKQCPGIVSCADITAMAAQLSVKKLSGGKFTWAVPLGRRDGLTSSAADTTGKLPPPTANVATLKSIFAAVGLTTEEMVTLSGAHSVGVASCGAIQNRLTTPPDATLDPTYAAALKQQCPAGSTNKVNLDLTTPTRLDEVYYKNLQARKGLMTSDQVLQEDPETQPMVAQHTNLAVFNSKFVAAMIKMGNIGVLTGTQGQIRLNCRKFNP
ncbi:hypothetical protein KC19_6G197300 [Ceratodon purpureus]|uniref:Peroxidase n=1 Tax=Ceratodon purpureus TaxID=3225 RepID=A0A8T0HJE7_CERPU|nr:hypothetical protein KC19_6G197300 [Ceratodon purpureus]